MKVYDTEKDLFLQLLTGTPDSHGLFCPDRQTKVNRRPGKRLRLVSGYLFHHCRNLYSMN
ncbi:hypothetical protein [Desulfomarina sp.]